MASNGKTLTRDELESLLTPQRLNEGRDAIVDKVHVEEAMDSTDDESLYVYVVLVDSIGEQQINLDLVRPIERAVRDMLRRDGESRWAYVTIGTPKDYEGSRGPVGDEDDEEQAA